MKGYVIGKQGSGLQKIMQESGANVLSGNIHQAGFTVIGNKRQIEHAKTLILEIVVCSFYYATFWTEDLVFVTQFISEVFLFTLVCTVLVKLGLFVCLFFVFRTWFLTPGALSVCFSRKTLWIGTA